MEQVAALEAHWLEIGEQALQQLVGQGFQVTIVVQDQIQDRGEVLGPEQDFAQADFVAPMMPAPEQEV